MVIERTSFLVFRCHQAWEYSTISSQNTFSSINHLHNLSPNSGGDGVGAVYGTYWSLQPLCHLLYFLSHTGIYFCWAHSLLPCFRGAIFCCALNDHLHTTPGCFIPWSPFRNTKSLGFGFCLLCAKYFTIWTSSSIVYQSHWSPQFSISVVRCVAFLMKKQQALKPVWLRG